MSDTARLEDRPLRVVYLIPHGGVRGPMGRICDLLIRALGEAGCTVTPIGYGSRGTQMPRWLNLLRQAEDILRVSGQVRVLCPDVLLVGTSHGWQTMLRDIPLLVCMGRPYGVTVLQFHGTRAHLLGKPGHRVFTLASRVVATLATCCLVLSREEARAWSQFVPRGRFVAVSNPFLGQGKGPSPASSPPLTQEPVVLYVGRLLRFKGVYELLEAFERLQKTVPCRLSFVGDGPELQGLERRAAEAGLSTRVEFRGYLQSEALWRAYHEADVLALPSHAEGFPTVLAEAMFHDLPFVTTGIRGAADHFENGVHAMLIRPGDVPGLREALEAVLTNQGLRDRMVTANRRKLDEFAPEVVASRYVELLRSLLRDAGDAGSSGWGVSRMRRNRRCLIGRRASLRR